jgi:hypothetical protein
MTEAKRPTAPKQDKPKPAEGDAKEDEPKKPETKNDEQKWMRFFAEFGVDGFAAWTPFEHPTLGKVEIGGFRPGARTNPPTSLGVEKDLAERHAVFLGEIAGQRPVLELSASAERAGPGLWTVRARVTNSGRLSTKAVMGERARASPPTTLTVGVDDAAIVSGSNRVSAERIEGLGGTLDATWTILMKEGGSVEVVMGSPLTGRIVKSVELK